MKFKMIPICPGASQLGYVEDAKQDVLMQGHARHFVNGEAGLTWACALSNMAKDPENKSRFPHPLKEMFITGKTTGFALTGQKHKGLFIYIKYAHDFGVQIDMNDARLSQKLAKENSEIFEQEFLLRAPNKKKRKIVRTQPTSKRTSSPRKTFRILGATARAFAAGLISTADIQRMKPSMNAYERARMSSVKKRS